MKISILTLFPQMFDGPFNYSIIKRAQDKKIIDISFIDIRNFGIGSHKIIDDRPYGGGAGMIMRADVIDKAIDFARNKKPKRKSHKEKVILLDPQGKTFNQKKAKELSKIDHLILICSHYEGIDERVRKFVDEEISIGDYILTGGELPAMVITDAIARLIPGVLGKNESAVFESFQEFLIDNKKIKLLEYPQYTRPEKFKNLKVPQILLSGDHKKISDWRKEEAIKKTKKRRIDLLK